MDLHVDVKEAAEELAEKLQKDPGLLKFRARTPPEDPYRDPGEETTTVEVMP